MNRIILVLVFAAGAFGWDGVLAHDHGWSLWGNVLPASVDSAVEDCTTSLGGITACKRELQDNGRYHIFRWNSPDPVCEGESTWNQENEACEEPPQCEQEPGEFAGHQELENPPEDGTWCYGLCQIVVEGYWQNAQTDLWVTTYVYTGETCSDGDGQGAPGDGSGEGDPADESGTTEEPLPDTDGDGIPDHNDDDIDGDGTPNSTDTDTDGDGVSDADDPTPNGDSETPGSARTGDSCVQRPTCTGDAIECAQLFEVWRLRCLTDGSGDFSDLLAEAGEGEIDSLSSGVDQAGTDEMDSYEQAATDSFNEPNPFEYSDSMESPIKGFAKNYPCQDYTVDFGSVQNLSGSFTMTCSQTQPLRDVIGWVFGFLTVLSIYFIAIRPVKE